MRIFHTSDWHLGRQTCGLSRRRDHEQVLDEILGHCRDFKPHLILHSGDLFENSRPAVEDMRLAQETLAQMSDLAPTVVIAGNHDSAALFDLFEALVGKARRLSFVGSVRRPDQGGVMEFAGDSGEIARV
ncbi:MAG: exonuclease subunit SbcD, partial [Candidatus Eremiobacteraeota bacterium]|nr:exonuclease subunit SbcD [Candidatus Eremiobacteraeota bacterium]